MLAKGFEQRKLVDKVFSVAKKAKDASALLGDDKVINGTIGSVYDNDGKLVVFDVVMEVYKNLPAVELAGYAPNFTGSDEFKIGVRKAIFGRDYQKSLENHYTSVMATPGGTGAISNTVKNYMNEGDTLLLPKWHWGPYNLFAKEKNGDCLYYSMFKDNKFDVEDFRKKVEFLAEKQDNVVMIINDPCHNPTGYRMSISEWKEVRSVLCEASKKANIILISDIAYMDFDDRDEKEKEEYLEIFKNLPENILVIFAFSISKSLTSYGMRVGAQLAITKSKEVIDEFETANSYSCRSTWSNVSRGGMKMFSEILLDDEKLAKLEQEREMYKKMIKERADAFIKEAKECNLKYLPYTSGFFLTIPTGEYTPKVEELLEKNHIYTVVLKEGVRLAVCSIPIHKIYGLAKKIKDIIEEAKRG